ncbi:MAG: hypothetical protein ACE5I1_03015 [bacterium]
MFFKPPKFTIIIYAIIFCIAAQAFAQEHENTPMPGFNLAGSHQKAIKIADEVMKKLGGRKNWDDTRFVTWKFFSRRLHVWDKWTGNIRFEGNNMVVLMNLNTKQGRAWKDGEEITHPDSLEKALYRAESAWINDSYWVFMPYKLKDTGVTLKYVGAGEMENGRAADVLELTFRDIGRTPQNKYRVYVDKETNLVEQWDFYMDATDPEPRFKTPWANWQQYGKIMLSDDRGRGKHSEIAVFEELPTSVFESYGPVDMMAFVKKAAQKQ